MTSKTKMITELGEGELLLPRLVNDALSANDRVKYYFTLLQMAKSHADNPDLDHSNLKKERQASGVEGDKLDSVVEQSGKVKDGNYSIPGARKIYNNIIEDIANMLAPLEAIDKGGKGKYGTFNNRFQTLVSKLPEMEKNTVQGAQIKAMTMGQRKKGDSLHLLVMDLHKELNKLQSKISKETIDGARVYGIEDTDRPLVKAFMKGLNETAKLKFEHPGLGTTVTRTKKRLVIQNDVGNRYASTTIVAAITSTIKAYPVTVVLHKGEAGLEKRSMVNLAHVLTVDKTRLSRRLGKLGGERMEAVDEAIRTSLRV